MALLLQLQLPVRMLTLTLAAIMTSASASIGVLDPAMEWKYGSAQANFSEPLPLAPSRLKQIREALSTNVDAIRQLLKEEELASQAPPNQNQDDVSRYSERIAVDFHVAQRDATRLNPLFAATTGLSPLASKSLRWASQHQASLANNELSRTGKPVGGSTQENRAATNPSSAPKTNRNNSPDEKEFGDGDLECERTTQPHMFIVIVGAVSGCCFLCCFCVCFAKERRFFRKHDINETVIEDQHSLRDELHEVWVVQEWRHLAPGIEAQLHHQFTEPMIASASEPSASQSWLDNEPFIEPD